MENMTNTISTHNKKTNSCNETCNYRNKSNCPLNKKCLSYPKKFTLVSARQNLTPGTTTIQCHLEIGHRKILPNFQNIFGVKRLK